MLEQAADLYNISAVVLVAGSIVEVSVIHVVVVVVVHTIAVSKVATNVVYLDDTLPVEMEECLSGQLKIIYQRLSVNRVNYLYYRVYQRTLDFMLIFVVNLYFFILALIAFEGLE